MNKPIHFKNLPKEQQIPWGNYEVQLNTIEWQEFRINILERDQRKCTKCGREATEKYKGKYYRSLTDEEVQARQTEVVVYPLEDHSLMFKMQLATALDEETETPVILHVHHKYYYFAYLPWEYTLDALTTLCHECHYDLHSRETVPVYYDERKLEKIPVTPCKRCFGTGFLKEYYHYQNGICFRCHGKKYEEFIK